jgi:hypothetical protein
VTACSSETLELETELVPSALEQGELQGYLWATALKTKKAVMENLLKAQKSIAQHLSIESIEGVHARFLSALDPSNPEASYLLTIGRAGVHLSSHIRFFNGNPSHSRSARRGSPHVTLPRAPVAT